MSVAAQRRRAFARRSARHARSGIAEERAVGGCTPHRTKAAWVEAHDRGDTLVVGDGVNDALALDSWPICRERPRSTAPSCPRARDFYFTTSGLGVQSATRSMWRATCDAWCASI